jgi:FkbM family methyltransferase
MMRAGEDLSGVVASYLGSLEFARRGIMDADRGGEIVLSAVEGFQIHSSLDDAAVGRYVRAGAYEPEVTAVFRRLLREGMNVVDIGANIGYFTMLSAHLVGATGHVTAVEPNRRNVRLIEASRRANGFDNITILQMAAGRQTGLLSLHSSHSNGTTSTLGDGVAAALAADTVACVRLDSIVERGRKIDFIKIDVEGAEYTALLGCQEIIRRDHPVIVSELSPNLMPGISGVDGEVYLRWLGEQGYAIAVIEADGSLTPPMRDGGAVLRRHAERGTDHIDIVALPDGG